VRLWVCGSAPLRATDRDAFRARFGAELLERYGMTETLLLTSQPLHGERRARSVGRALPGVELRIVDRASGGALPPGTVGEVQARGPSFFAGYWRAPELTAEVLKDGRYHTGDLARMDDDGFVYIVDRKKDMVISGGFNVYPSEVEAVLYQHEAVQDACVFAIPDDKWGEAVAAHVVLKSGRPADASLLDAFCGERLAGFKRPRRIEFVNALPRNPNGKVMRKAVQAPYWAGQQRMVN